MAATACWAVLGALHAVTALALFSPALLSRLYGVGPDAAFLLQHRAAFFLVIVVICVWAMFRVETRPLATAAVGLSMGSFLVLYALAGAPAGFRHIALADVAALPVLAVAGWAAFRPG